MIQDNEAKDIIGEIEDMRRKIAEMANDLALLETWYLRKIEEEVRLIHRGLLNYQDRLSDRLR